MLFNSLEFLVFFTVVTLLFFMLPHKSRWFFLLLASCFFYMFFKPVYILILAFTILIDYYAGLLIERTENPFIRKRYLLLSLIANIGVLAVFKYYNFLNDQVTGLAALFGYTNPIPYLKILLPLGLSFHTFQAMSYTVEVYRGNQKAEKHFGIYALYVMFFPQLVAGPIERPQHMLHQFHEVKHFDYENIFYGLKRIIWGLFKKVVIADRLAAMVDYVYQHPKDASGFAALLAAVLFAIQIYCDFSAYSDIAVGTARILGYRLMENFNFPFRSKNIGEFWRRWHISLSSWLRDYIYTPLAIDKRDWNLFGIAFALFITFAISGLWHGAGWTFILYGVFNGLAVIVEVYTKKQRKKLAKSLPAVLYNNISIILTFCYACITWIFFRSPSVSQAIYMLRTIFAGQPGSSYFTLVQKDLHGLPPTYLGLALWQFLTCLLLIPFLFISEWLISYNNTRRFDALPVYLRWTAYYIIIFSILMLGIYDTRQFIYFQF